MAGTWRKALIDGLPYNVMADSDANVTPGVENNPINHSGGTAQSKVRRSEEINALTLYLTPAEAERLRTLQKRIGYYSVGGVDDEGNTYKAIGFMNFTGYTAQNGTGTVTLHAKSKDGFALFLG